MRTQKERGGGGEKEGHMYLCIQLFSNTVYREKERGEREQRGRGRETQREREIERGRVRTQKERGGGRGGEKEGHMYLCIQLFSNTV